MPNLDGNSFFLLAMNFLGVDWKEAMIPFAIVLCVVYIIGLPLLLGHAFFRLWDWNNPLRDRCRKGRWLTKFGLVYSAPFLIAVGGRLAGLGLALLLGWIPWPGIWLVILVGAVICGVGFAYKVLQLNWPRAESSPAENSQVFHLNLDDEMKQK